MPEIPATDSVREHAYRVNVKQDTKGVWRGEYTVRADTPGELSEHLLSARVRVLDELRALNGKPSSSDGST